MYFNNLVERIFNRFSELFFNFLTNSKYYKSRNLDLLKNNILKAIPHIKSSISIYVDFYGCEEDNLDGFIEKNMKCFKEELLDIISC